MIEIYTDGSFDEKSKTGFWAFIIYYNQIEIARHHGQQNTTNNNQMEKLAARKSLEWLSIWPAFDLNDEIVLYTDSTGVVGKINKFKNQKIVSDQEWEPLIYLVHRVKWTWIRAHKGNSLHNKVDLLCRNLRKKVDISR